MRKLFLSTLSSTVNTLQITWAALKPTVVVVDHCSGELQIWEESNVVLYEQAKRKRYPFVNFFCDGVQYVESVVKNILMRNDVAVLKLG